MKVMVCSPCHITRLGELPTFHSLCALSELHQDQVSDRARLPHVAAKPQAGQMSTLNSTYLVHKWSGQVVGALISLHSNCGSIRASRLTQTILQMPIECLVLVARGGCASGSHGKTPT